LKLLAAPAPEIISKGKDFKMGGGGATRSMMCPGFVCPEFVCPGFVCPGFVCPGFVRVPSTVHRSK
jgi:hypothetical protein